MAPKVTDSGRIRYGERLDSWKEIAAYLRRGVRTVQRWERTRGLPVHRLQGGKRNAICADRSELDDWWHNRRTQLEVEQQESRKAKWRRLTWLGVLALLAIVILTALLWGGRLEPVVQLDEAEAAILALGV